MRACLLAILFCDCRAAVVTPRFAPAASSKVGSKAGAVRRSVSRSTQREGSRPRAGGGAFASRPRARSAQQGGVSSGVYRRRAGAAATGGVRAHCTGAATGAAGSGTAAAATARDASSDALCTYVRARAGRGCVGNAAAWPGRCKQLQLQKMPLLDFTQAPRPLPQPHLLQRPPDLQAVRHHAVQRLVRRAPQALHLALAAPAEEEGLSEKRYGVQGQGVSEMAAQRCRVAAAWALAEAAQASPLQRLVVGERRAPGRLWPAPLAPAYTAMRPQGLTAAAPRSRRAPRAAAPPPPPARLPPRCAASRPRPGVRGASGVWVQG